MTNTRPLAFELSNPERLAAIRRYAILDTPPDGSFDRVTMLAERFFNVPISLVTIVDKDRIWFKSRYGLDNVAEISLEPGLCASAILQDSIYVVEHASQDKRTLANTLVTQGFGLEFYAAVPLKTREGYTLGTFCILDHKPRSFNDPELTSALEAFGGIVMDELEIRISSMQAIASERKLREKVADTLQRSLLPESLPQLPHVQLDAMYKAAATEAHIGGDWYDAFQLNEHELLLSIGDVAGHQLESAIIMGKVRHSLRSLAYKAFSLTSLLEDLNALLQREAPECHVTALLAHLDVRTGRMEYVNAGHPPPIIRRENGKVESLKIGGLPLGLRLDDDASQEHITLHKGDITVFFTDGLIEGTRDIVLGEKLLNDQIAEYDPECGVALAHSLGIDLLPPELYDDVAIMTLVMKGTAA